MMGSLLDGDGAMQMGGMNVSEGGDVLREVGGEERSAGEAPDDRRDLEAAVAGVFKKGE